MGREHDAEAGENRLESALANALRVGVAISAVTVVCGGLLYLTANAGGPADYHVFKAEPRELQSPTAIILALRKPTGRGLIQLGLLLLIATPVARVGFSVIGFARQGDWLYVGISLIVLTLLTYSLTTG